MTFLIWFLIAFQEESLEKENQLFVEETGYLLLSSVEIESGPEPEIVRIPFLKFQVALSPAIW